MKKSNLYIVMMLLNIIAVSGFAQKRMRNAPLEISGAALLNDQQTKDYAISVYLDGTKIDSVFSKSKKSIYFFVNYNQVYTFLFQKAGCKDKIVIVNTTIPEGLKSMQDDTFDFAVEMSQALSKNSEIEDYPVAVLKISKDEEMLEASKDYHKFTHQ
jgi:hypothetical protein